MPYTVTWFVNTIERNLRLAPLSVGRDENGHRSYSIDPVEVVYHVSPDDRLVQILQIMVRE